MALEKEEPVDVEDDFVPDKKGFERCVHTSKGGEVSDDIAVTV